MDIEAFRSWLAERGYAESTVKQTCIDARTILTRCEKGLPLRAGLNATVARMAMFQPDLEEELGERFAFALRNKRIGANTQARKLPARSIDDASWKVLFQRIVEDNSAEARILEIMVVGGARVGDVFRLTRAALRDGLADGVVRYQTKGGKYREQRLSSPLVRSAFQRLWDSWAHGGTVMEWVMDGDPNAAYSAAYARVNRKLKRLSTDLPGRAYSHRLRRTVAVQAFRTTQDLMAVRELLGHTNIATTQVYLDESRPDAVASLQDKIHTQFLEDGE